MARFALHLAAIVESSDDAIVSKDLNGIITSWNRAAVRIFGYEASEVIGKSIRILIPADRQGEEDHVLSRIRAGEMVDHFETVRVRKDGTEIDISLTVSPIRAADGTIVGASKIARDITERRRLEKALASADLQNRLLADIGEALAKARSHREMLEAVGLMLVPDIADECVLEVLGPDGTSQRVPDDAPLLPAAEQVARGGVPVLTEALVSVPLRVRTGVIGAVTCANTVSGRRFMERDRRFIMAVAERTALAVENARAYEEAREANRLKDDFLATLSHELRTPLNAILGYTRMLRTRTVAPDRREAALGVVERNATALAQIVNDVLDISRVVAGKLVVRVEPVALPQLVEDAVATLLPAAAAKNVEIRTRIALDTQTIVADPDRMQQVLWNLLSNAVKFSGRGGLVTVDVRHVDAEVHIIVSDTGEGIPADFLPFVFERFRQADTRLAGVRSGLGIGLAISRHIVEMHGGTIEASSEGRGQGATFRIKLPIAASAQPILSAIAPRSTPTKA